MKMLLLLCLMVSCSTTEPVKNPPGDMAEVALAQAERLEKLAVNLDELGRIESLLLDCDGYLWQGKFCAATGCKMDDYEEDGRLYRRPAPRCYENGVDQGSKTTWSKDMAVGGLIPMVLLQGDFELMKRHLDYGDKNSWLMGEPQKGADELTRIFYNPPLVDLLFDVEMYARVKKAPKYYDFYTQQHLVDYQAHLQVAKIWAKSYMRQEFSEGEVSAIKKHFERVPRSPFYAFVYAQATGDFEPITKECLSEEVYFGDYIRCHDPVMCGMAEKVFACHLLIKAAHD